MIKKLFLLVMLFSGCVSTDESISNETFDKHIAENPKYAEQIRQQIKDNQQQVHLQKTAAPRNNYTVNTETTSKLVLAEVTPGIGIGHGEYVNHHKINFTLVCDKDNFVPRYAIHKKFKWKISESLKGETTTSFKGEAQIYFTNDLSSKFPKITITTGEKSYDFDLIGELVFELPKAECDKSGS